MKKTIIITILLVYVASIVIVNFFGMKAEEFSGTVYVKSIEYNVRPTDDYAPSIEPAYYNGYDDPWYVFEFIPPPDGTEYSPDDLLNIAENPNAIFIDVNVLPIDAKNIVDFMYDAENNKEKVYFNDEKNTFIFIKPCRIYVTIEAQDGSKTKTSFYINCKAKKN